MAADAGIFQQYLTPVRSVADYRGDMDKQEQNALTLAASRLAAQQAQQSMADDQAARQASIASGGDNNKLIQALFASGNHKAAQAVQKQMLDAEESRAKAGHLKSQSSKLDAETLDKALETTRSFANHVDSPQAAEMYLKGLYSHPLLGQVAASMMPLDQAIARIPQDMNSPEGLRWKATNVNISGKDLMGLLMPKTDSTNLGGNMSFGATDQFSGKRTQTGAAPITQSADNAATNATSRANNAASVGATIRGQNMTERHFQTGQNTPQYMETDAGLVALPKKLAPGQSPTGVPVMGADGQPLGKPLKAIPAAVNSAIIQNSQSINQIDRALNLLKGVDQDGMKGDKNATGLKGYLPNGLLNRLDPQGVDGRAIISDIGSLKIHDRSGAAVTISESPRLMPFIPLSTDDAATVDKKLNKLRVELSGESRALQDVYSKDQGYKPSPVKAPASNRIPSGWSVKEH